MGMLGDLYCSINWHSSLVIFKPVIGEKRRRIGRGGIANVKGQGVIPLPDIY